jgi:hypothetical protein
MLLAITGVRMKINHEQINIFKKLEKKILYNALSFQVKEARNKIFHIALQSFFQTAKQDIAGKIILAGAVMSDGMGDYYSILKAAKLTKKQYPNASVKIIAEVDPVHKNKINSSKIECLIYYSNGISGKMPLELGKELAEASQILHLSRPIDAKSYPIGLDDEITAILNKTKVIWELVCFNDIFSISNVGMGIGPLRAGIFITKMPKEKDLAQLQSAKLRQTLTGNVSATTEDWDAYQLENEIAFAYFSAKIGWREQYRRIYINSIVYLEKEKSKKLDLIMAAPDLDRLIDRNFLNDCGIRKIVHIKQGEVTSESELGEEGKELRLIDPFPLSHHDFKIILLNSHPLTGCTGDQSLCEALSFQKIPFYDVASNIKRGLPSYLSSVDDTDSILGEYYQLVHRLSHVGFSHPSYLQSEMHKPEAPANWEKACKELAIKISTLIKNPNLQNQLNEEVSYLKEYNDLGAYIQKTIQHSAFKILNPEFVKQSEVLRDKYEKEEIELSEAIKELSSKF